MPRPEQGHHPRMVVSGRDLQVLEGLLLAIQGQQGPRQVRASVGEVGLQPQRLAELDSAEGAALCYRTICAEGAALLGAGTARVVAEAAPPDEIVLADGDLEVSELDRLLSPEAMTRPRRISG